LELKNKYAVLISLTVCLNQRKEAERENREN